MSLTSPLRALLAASAASCFLMACSAIPPSTTAAPAAAPADNARTALDWAGTYRGTLPCADCSGIETTVALEPDGHYASTMTYLGKNTSYSDQGAFAWNAAGNMVTLQGQDPAHYKVEEGRIVRVQADGTPVEGPLASHYVLKKLP